MGDRRSPDGMRAHASRTNSVGCEILPATLSEFRPPRGQSRPDEPACTRVCPKLRSGADKVDRMIRHVSDFVRSDLAMPGRSSRVRLAEVASIHEPELGRNFRPVALVGRPVAHLEATD